MPANIDSLSERERQVLRLLLRGHTAKSAAIELDLSVHTVNDYLREARKKLGVGSSKEAARLLGKSENAAPKKLAPDEIGIAISQSNKQIGAPSSGHLTAPTLIGVLVMLASVLAVMFFLAESDKPAQSERSLPITLEAADEAVKQDAISWLNLIDQNEWQSSWDEASSFVHGAVTEEQWIESISKGREMTGAVVSRELTTITAHSELPGVPPGEYRIVQFNTSFASASAATEVVTLVREDGSWKVAGYFIR